MASSQKRMRRSGLEFSSTTCGTYCKTGRSLCLQVFVCLHNVTYLIHLCFCLFSCSHFANLRFSLPLLLVCIVLGFNLVYRLASSASFAAQSSGNLLLPAVPLGFTVIIPRREKLGKALNALISSRPTSPVPAKSSEAAQEESTSEAESKGAKLEVVSKSFPVRTHSSPTPFQGVAHSRSPPSTDDQFEAWLQVELSRFDAFVFALLTSALALQAWLSSFHPTDLFILVVLLVVLCLRLARPGRRDGSSWCSVMLMLQVGHAATVAFGSHDRVQQIVAPKLANREVALVASLLIGLLHSTQPISRSARLRVGILYESLFLLWLAPIVFPAWHPAYKAWPRQEERAWLHLTLGSAIAFAIGATVVDHFVQQKLRPIWKAGRAQHAVAEAAQERQEQLLAEKDRIYARQEQLLAEKDRIYMDWQLSQREVQRLCQSSRLNHSSLSTFHASAQAHKEQGQEGICSMPEDDDIQNIRCTTSEVTESHNSEIAELNTGSPDEQDSFLPRYRLLPQYRNERGRSGAYGEGEYLTARDMHVVHGHDPSGLATDMMGSLLNPTCEVKEAIFVVNTDFEVLFSFDLARHRHSSLVAGGDVLTAGSMRVVCGRILSVDNCSGHYRPPAASLHVLEECLRSQGISLEEAVFSPMDLGEDRSSCASSLLPGIVECHLLGTDDISRPLAR